MSAHATNDVSASTKPHRFTFRSRLFFNKERRSLEKLGIQVESVKSVKPVNPLNKPAKGKGKSKGKGPLGLTPLFEPKDEALVDIIFVHGLGGDSRKTWTDSDVDNGFWPQSWLRDDPDFENVRIHSFGYNAQWKDLDLSVLSIHDFGQTLLSEMRNSPGIRRTKRGAIIMVCHSMGGCVAKAAYVLARQNPSFSTFASRFRAFFFLATPHTGSGFATMFRGVLMLAGISKPYIGDLSAVSPTLRDLNGSFLRYQEDLRFWSFFETRPVLKLPRIFVVDEASAKLGCGERLEKAEGLDADHRHICKYKSVKDKNYEKVRGALSTAVKMAISEDHSHPSAEMILKSYLGVGDSYHDDLSLFQETRLPGSCTWPADRDLFKNWMAASPAMLPIMWLTGQAGAGKSIISSSVVELLKAGGHSCCYYFFHQGQASSVGIGSLLTHLAYQMALRDAAVREKILSLQEEGVSWQPHDDRSIWRKLFLEGVFATTSAMTHYWVVDGLDECSGAAAFMRLLPQLPKTIRVFVASRSTAEVDRGLVELGSRVEVYSMSAQDTVADMRAVIEASLEILSLQDIDDLGARILARSSGSFIWVRLVLQELQKASPGEDVEEILNSVPDSRSEFYKRIITAIESNEKCARIAKSILFFVVLAVRPMTAEELCHAVRLDTGWSLNRMEQVIKVVCGQLVTTDQGGRVRIVHETARDFLLSQGLESPLAVSRDQGHGYFARLCLSYIDDLFRRERQGSADSGGSIGLPNNYHDVAFLNYASTLFSQHLLGCAQGDAATFRAMQEFLERNILHWIQYIADDCDISSLTRTSMDVSRYVELSPGSRPLEGVEKLKSWALDLSRVALTFGDQLRRDPSAIHDLIPALCPRDSSIATSVTQRPTAVRFSGLQGTSWDDSVARSQTRDATTVAFGETLLAVGELDGEITVYDTTYLQFVTGLRHPGLLLHLQLGYRDQFLVSACKDRVCIWNSRSGSLVHGFECSTPKALSLSKGFLLVTQNDGVLLSCDLATLAVETGRWLPAVDQTDRTKPWSVNRIQHAVFCKARQGVVAASFWTNDAYIFEADGTCVRGPYSGPKGRIVHALALDTSPGANALVVAYTGDYLVVFDIQTPEICSLLPQVPARALAFSPDGRFLIAATTGSQHALEVFRVVGDKGPVSLAPVHRIPYMSRTLSGFAVASSGLRLASLHGNDCRIWDPSRSIERLKGDEQAPAARVETTTGVNKPPSITPTKKGEISAMCLSADGKAAICGTDHGDVVCFDTSDGAELGVLYRDRALDQVSQIAFVERQDRDMVIIVYYEAYPPGSHIVIADIDHAPTVWSESAINVLCEREEDGRVDRVLVSPSKDRLLVVRGSCIGLLELPSGRILLSNKQVLNTRSVIRSARQDPSDSRAFMVYDEASAHLFNWTDGEPAPGRQLTLVRDGPHLEKGQSRTPLNFHSGHFSVEVLLHPNILIKGSQQSAAQLTCWPVSDPPSQAASKLLPVRGLQHLSNVLSTGLCVMGDSTFVFVDRDLWVCSVDLGAFPSTFTARRHFFLLPEWTTSEGWVQACLVAHTGGLVLATRQGVLVVENWMASWQTVRLRPGWKAWEVVSLRQVDVPRLRYAAASASESGSESSAEQSRQEG